MLSQYKKRHQIKTKNYWKSKRRLRVKLFEVTNTTCMRKSANCRAQITTIGGVDTDLRFAFCRFSQVVFVTLNNCTCTLLFNFQYFWVLSGGGQNCLLILFHFPCLLNDKKLDLVLNQPNLLHQAYLVSTCSKKTAFAVPPNSFFLCW